MKKAKAEFHHKNDGPSGKTNLINKNDKNALLFERNKISSFAARDL